MAVTAGAPETDAPENDARYVASGTRIIRCTSSGSRPNVAIGVDGADA